VIVCGCFRFLRKRKDLLVFILFASLPLPFTLQAACRSRPCALPRFGTGDPLYCDRDYVCSALPDRLRAQQPHLVAVLTAQSDKRSFSKHFMRFTVSRAAVVMVGFDSRIAELPSWLSTSGFKWMDLELPGTEPDFVYRLYGKRCEESSRSAS